MTAARHLSLVPATGADVIPLPRRASVEHNALRHAVLREAAEGLILRSGQRITINGRTVSPDTASAIDALTEADCIGWTGDPQAGRGIGGITKAGKRQLAEWNRPRPGPSGDAA